MFLQTTSTKVSAGTPDQVQVTIYILYKLWMRLYTSPVYCEQVHHLSTRPPKVPPNRIESVQGEAKMLLKTHKEVSCIRSL